MELERFLENQTEMLGNLTITDSICIDTLRDICERYCELKKLRVTDVSVCACGSTKYYIEQYKDVTKYYCSKCHEKIESKH
jgi:hypothetical protein